MAKLQQTYSDHLSFEAVKVCAALLKTFTLKQSLLNGNRLPINHDNYCHTFLRRYGCHFYSWGRNLYKCNKTALESI
jgi:hypothetical protein